MWQTEFSAVNIANDLSSRIPETDFRTKVHIIMNLQYFPVEGCEEINKKQSRRKKKSQKDKSFHVTRDILTFPHLSVIFEVQ